MGLNFEAWDQQTIRILDQSKWDYDDASLVGQFRSVTKSSRDELEFMQQLHEAVDLLDPAKDLIKMYPHGERQLAFAVRRKAVFPGDATVADYGLPTIVWSVNELGALYARFSYLPHAHWSMGDLRRASDDGYSEFDWTDVLVWESDGGIGGDQAEYDLLSFLLEHGVELGVGATSWAGAWLAKFGLRLRRTRKADRRARIVVRRWNNRGYDNPWMIRAWFESKEKWRLPEVSKRLQIPQATAADILRALGYERMSEQRAAWILSTRAGAVRKRKKWKRSETTTDLREDLY